MAHNDSEKIKGFIEGLLIGGAVASIFTLLYAPKSGKKLRKDIQRRSTDLSEDVVEKYKELQERAERLLADTDKKVHKLVSEGEEMVSNITKKVKKS